MHRLQPLVDHARAEEAAERVSDVGFVLIRHRHVGMKPVAEDAEADEVLALDRDELLGELAAGAGEISRRHFLPLRAADLFVDRMLMGSPWQSHPGTYGESKPIIVFD